MRGRGALLALIVAGGLVAAGGVARAGAGSVSVLGISGNGGAHFAEQLEQDLAELYEVVPGDVYRSTAERLGRRGATPDEVREVCTAIRVDAIVAGAISGEGSKRALVMAIREGASGRVVARGRYDLAGRTLPLIRDKVLRDLVRVFERVRKIPKRGQPLVEAPTPEAEPEEGAAAQPGEEPLPATGVTERQAPHKRAHRGFYAGIGPALMSRSLSFDVPTAPGYRRGAAAGLRVDGLVFPLALSTELSDAHPVLSSFGLSGSYQRSFGLRSTTAITSIAGEASRWDIMFVGRAPLGHRGGALTIETGYQQLRWVSSSPVQLGVPDVGYGLFDFGLRFEHTLGTDIVELAVRAAGLAIADAGAIATDQEYGPTSGGGLELDLGLTIRPRAWVWLRAGVRYTPLFLRFAAAGARLAHSATDQLVDAAVQVGFAL
jgi:hypothetical protein